MSTPTIITSRLVLRPLTEADIDPLHRIFGEEGMLRYFPVTAPPARERIARMVLGQREHWEQHGYGLWAVTSHGTGELMGRSGLQYLPETSETEIDFVLGKRFWGQGFATEAGRAGLRYGFEEFGLECIVGIVHPGNLASQRVLEKLGMQRESRAQYFGMDCYRYVMQLSDYAELHPDHMGARTPR